MIRIVMTGDITEVERKTLAGGKNVTNFKITDSGLSLRGSAWGEIADQMPAGGRALVEGKLAGRSYERDGQPRTSTEITVSSIEVLNGAPAATADDDDLFA